jgi:hypothetical protein
MADETSEIRAQVKEARARLEEDLEHLAEITSRRRAKLRTLGSVLAVSAVAIVVATIAKHVRNRHR